jgi:hypothetical protein
VIKKILFLCMMLMILLMPKGPVEAVLLLMKNLSARPTGRNIMPTVIK